MSAVQLMQLRGLKPVAILGARRPHGDRLRYMSGCKCLHCRMANSNYETGRARARRAGEWNGLVDATPARTHLRRLSRKGIGYKTTADAASVARSVVAKIVAGTKLRIRASTARRILKTTVAARADGSPVAAAPTWRLINELLEEGFTKARIARELGSKTPALQIRRGFVRARTALLVEKLWRKYMQ